MAVAEWLDGYDHSEGNERWVRFNGGEQFWADIEALAGRSFDGAILSKVTEAREVADAVRSLTREGLCATVVPLIETARGLLACADIAMVPGVHRMMLGEADLGAELGLIPRDPAWDGIRVQVVVASAAARIQPPIGPVDPDFTDLERFTRDTRRLRSLGFSARAAVHPAQIGAIHTAMMPSSEEVARAMALLDACGMTQEGSVGAMIGPDGAMVDEAYLRWARRIVAAADQSDEKSDQ